MKLNTEFHEMNDGSPILLCVFLSPTTRLYVSRGQGFLCFVQLDQWLAQQVQLISAAE